jgi:hypothetical protein
LSDGAPVAVAIGCDAYVFDSATGCATRRLRRGWLSEPVIRSQEERTGCRIEPVPHANPRGAAPFGTFWQVLGQGAGIA